MKSIPKYSIIIPTRNGGKYLPSCVGTVIGQNFSDYELIISDNCSSDNTSDYLDNLSHPNVRIIKPAHDLCMAEHYEFALSQARGEWQIILGVDDGLQPYFFQLAEMLTKLADKKKVRAIRGVRANYYWPGCQFIYGRIAVCYQAKNYVRLVDTNFRMLRALWGLGPVSYADLPQMYSTSVFRKDLLDDARSRQNGKVFTSLNPDTNLAAIGCSLENKFLESGIPLGWVGTSPNSISIVGNTYFKHVLDGSENEAGKDFLNNRASMPKILGDALSLVSGSGLSYHYLAGNFMNSSSIIHFWESLLQTKNLRDKSFNDFLQSKFFKTIMFAAAISEMNGSPGLVTQAHLQMVKEVVYINNCSYNLVRIISFLWFIFGKIYDRLAGMARRIIFALDDSTMCYMVYWNDNSGMTLEKASVVVNKLVQDKKLIEKLKLDKL